MTFEKILPQTGRMLVAVPGLDEPHFNHSVVTLIDYHRDEDVVGIVVNRSTPITLDKAIDGVAPDRKIPLYLGGPVGNDRLLYLHTLGSAFHGTREVSPGLFLGGSLEDVIEYVNAGYQVEGTIRFFVGYSGWSPGQLEGEIESDSWVVTNAMAPHTMLSLSDNAMWHRAVSTLGDDFSHWRYSPMYPHLN